MVNLGLSLNRKIGAFLLLKSCKSLARIASLRREHLVGQNIYREILAPLNTQICRSLFRSFLVNYLLTKYIWQ